MILAEIDHIAVAVRDLEAPSDHHRAFGAEAHHSDVVASDGVDEALVEVADSEVQLTAATRWPDSPIDDCVAAVQAMVDAGATPIDEQPRHDRGARAPDGQLRHPHRARPGVTGCT